MSDVQASKGASASSGASGVAASAATPAGSVMVDKSATIRQPPPDVRPTPHHPAQIEGRVTAHDPETGETRIHTARGDITLVTQAELAVDTKVILSLYTEKAEMKARIFVQRAQHAIQQQATEDIAPATPRPLPPLTAGDIVAALRLPPVASGTAPPPQTRPDLPHTLPAEQVVRILQAVKPYITAQQLAGVLPVPPDVGAQLFNATDTSSAFHALPAEMQHNISATVSAPQTLTLARAVVPETVWTDINTTPLPAKFVPAQDHDLAEILSRSTPLPATATQNTPAPETVFARLATAFLPFLGFNLPTASAAHVMPVTAGAKMSMPDGFQHAPLPDNMYKMRVVSLTPAGGAPPVVTQPDGAAPPTARINGIISAITPNGYPVIETAQGDFVLQSAFQVAEGTHIIAELSPMTAQEMINLTPAAPTATPSAASAPFADLAPLASLTWPAVNEILHINTDGLDQAYQALTQNLRNALPTPTARMTPAVLFFLAALRMGEIENWLGDKAVSRARDSKHSGLIDRLTGDFKRIGEQSRETLAQGWKMFSIPVLHEEHVGQIRMYIRHSHADGENENSTAKSGTRFLLNFDLSRMGEMQLDGYLKQKSLNIILRSRETLPFDMRQDIMKAFATGLEHAHLQGGITFQANPENRVYIDNTPHSGRVV